MSHLTTKTNIVYVAMLYNEHSEYMGESRDCDSAEEAIDEGREMVANAVMKTDKYYFAEIKTKILPVWG